MQNAVMDKHHVVGAVAELAAGRSAFLGGEGAVDRQVAGIVYGMDARRIDAVPRQESAGGGGASKDQRQALPTPQIDGADDTADAGRGAGEIDVGKKIGDGDGDCPAEK